MVSRRCTQKPSLVFAPRRAVQGRDGPCGSGISRADRERLFYRDRNYADEDVILEVLKVYKGTLVTPKPCVRIEIYSYRWWDANGAPRLPAVGDEVILPIEVLPPRAGSHPQPVRACTTWHRFSTRLRKMVRSVRFLGFHRKWQRMRRL